MKNASAKASAAAQPKHVAAKPSRSKMPSVAETGPRGSAGTDRDTLTRLRAAAALSDDRIDLTDPDAPLVTDWRGAVQGKFFRPVKRLKSFRIDADVLAYFEGQGKGYQATVNRVLREAMLRDIRDFEGKIAQRKAKKL